MAPTIHIVACPGHDWGVVYFTTNNSDKKVYEGHDWSSNGIAAMAELLGTYLTGSQLRYHEFTNRDEVDGCTPDKFKDIVGITDVPTT